MTEYWLQKTSITFNNADIFCLCFYHRVSQFSQFTEYFSNLIPRFSLPPVGGSPGNQVEYFSNPDLPNKVELQVAE